MVVSVIAKSHRIDDTTKNSYTYLPNASICSTTSRSPIALCGRPTIGPVCHLAMLDRRLVSTSDSFSHQKRCRIKEEETTSFYLQARKRTKYIIGARWQVICFAPMDCPIILQYGKNGHVVHRWCRASCPLVTLLLLILQKRSLPRYIRYV